MTHRDPKWLQAVVSLEACVLCGKYGVQAAHRNVGKGMGMKTSDCLTAALCPACHDEIDNGPNMTKAERRAQLNEAVVRTFERLVCAGKVGVL